MAHWDKRPAAQANLRMLEAPDIWRRYLDDVDDTDKSVKTPGCFAALDRFLLNALNSTNLLVLTGAGSSFCAVNSDKSKLATRTAPGLKELFEAVKSGVGAAKFDAAVAKIPNGTAITDIEKLLTQCKLYVALYDDKSGDGKLVSDFIADAEKAILARVDFVDDGTDLTSHDMLLRKLARRGIRKPRVKVFTTNYDLCFEYAARHQRFVVIDGFSHAAPPVYDRSQFTLDIVRRDFGKDAPDYFESVFQLYKLHGSIDWRRTGTEIIRSRANEHKPVLIYPRDSKYQEAFEPPYLDMMAALQAALRQPDTALLVAGFSFADSHIAQPVIAAIESNMSLRLVVCDPAFLADDDVKDDPVTVTAKAEPKKSFHQKLLRLAKTGDQRVLLLHGRFEDLSLVLPDMVAETERERHAQRITSLREAESPETGTAPA